MVNESWEFDQIEFSTPDDDDLTVEKMFLQQHDPNLLYMSMEELKEFLDTKDGLDDKVDARLRLELFQMGIQYVEAFFMYFSAQLKGNANVVKDLITTRPGDVRQMC